ncbi:MAG: phage holin family protein, partial [Rhodoplanes sp.]
MFDRLVSRVKVEAQSLATTLVCAVVAGVSAIVAVLFIGIAIFIWASERYGSLTASLAMAGFFLVVAMIAIAVLFYIRSEAQKRAARRADEERREREE